MNEPTVENDDNLNPVVVGRPNRRFWVITDPDGEIVYSGVLERTKEEALMEADESCISVPPNRCAQVELTEVKP